MNRYILALFISFLSLHASAYDNVTIRGTITHSSADSIFVVYDGGNYVHYEQKVVGAKIDSEGFFSLSLKIIGKIAQLDMQLGDQTTELLVQPGYHLEVTADGKKFTKSIHYKGIGAETANFVAGHTVNKGNMMNLYMMNRQFVLKDPPDYQQAITNAYKEEIKYMADSGRALPPAIKDYWSQYYLYASFNCMMVYPRYHEMVKQKTNHITEIPKADYAIIYKIPERFRDQLMAIPSYRQYVGNILYAKLMADGYKSPQTEEERQKMADTVNALATQKMPNRTLEFYKAWDLNMHIGKEPLKKSEQKLAQFRNQWPHSMYMSVLQHNMMEAKKLSPGQPAIDFDITEPDGTHMKLSDLKGKVVYLDFWASWCGPCMGQMPFSKKVEAHYKGKDVAFVYVSIDQDSDAWKKAIKAHDIEGIHTRVDGWQSEVAVHYNINSVPSYFLIDKNGNFVTSETPRPSQTKELEKEIDKLLK